MLDFELALEARAAIRIGRTCGAGDAAARTSAIVVTAVRLAEALAVLDLELVAGGTCAGLVVRDAEARGRTVLDLDLALEAARTVDIAGARLIDDRATRRARRILGARGEKNRSQDERDLYSVFEHGRTAPLHGTNQHRALGAPSQIRCASPCRDRCAHAC